MIGFFTQSAELSWKIEASTDVEMKDVSEDASKESSEKPKEEEKDADVITYEGT